MAIFVVRNKKEKNDKIISRFKKMCFGAHLMPQVKSKIHFMQKPSKIQVRKRALKRNHYRDIQSKADILS
jgi:hypothetical protein